MRDEDNETTQVELILCAAGDARKSWMEVWGRPMCAVCAAAWSAEAPSDEFWYAAHPEDTERFAVKKAWTARWLDARKGKAAA